jgi:drug/metabolite transporter (DMT)-like permease
MPPLSLAPYLSLALAMLIVGSSVVAGKLLTVELPVFLASTLRFLLAALLLVPLLWRNEGGLPRLSRRSWLMLGLQALCGSFLFTVFTLYGLRLTSAASAALITSTAPAFIGLLGWILLREKPRAAAWAGLALAMLGIGLINLPEVGESPNALFSGDALLGNLMLLAAVIFEAFFLLLRKFVREPVSSLAGSTVLTLYGLLFFAPVGLVEALSFDFGSASVTSWAAVGYYGVFITAVAYLFWLAGIVRVPASRAAPFTALMPVSGMLLAWLFLGETLAWRHWAGLTCVCLALLAPLFERRKHS